jgi:glycosyltransferase involved in cell wall biosynthesis
MESNEKVTTLNEESVFNARYVFSGKYGENLLQEVARYALVGAQIARDSDFDLIHAHDWLTYSAGVAAKQATGKPLVVHMHATEFDRSGESVNQRVYDIERAGMEAADRVITVSNLTRNIVIERYGIDPAKVITVHNAVEPVEKPDAEKTEKHVPEKIVTFLGRVTFQKGPEYFIEAAYKVLQRDPNVRFVMAGTGDLLEKMIRRVAQLKISTKFHFTGFLRGDNVDKMFAMSDVYVMPSVSEPFGISPLEAMRSNVPVVISKQSGVAEILHHALKVDFWDIDAMADAIYGLLQYKSLPEMFSKYGAMEVDNLKWENAARHIKTVYEQVYQE